MTEAFSRRSVLGGAGVGLMALTTPGALARARHEPLTIMNVGDLILDHPEVSKSFAEIGPTLRAGDVVIGQVEVPHTLRGQYSSYEQFAMPGADPEHLKLLPPVGFNVATLAGNHTFDQGQNGVEDTLASLRALGIATAGGGMNIDEARRPAMVRKKGKTVAVLSYNAVGPQEMWASPVKAGAAYVRVLAAYTNEMADPGASPTSVHTTVDISTLDKMVADVVQARKLCDYLVVNFHAGRAGSPQILNYQRQITRAAIENGADMVTASHTHSLLGVEFYRGKPIFHGLGNFVSRSTAFEKDNPANKARNIKPFDSPITIPPWPHNAYASILAENAAGIKSDYRKLTIIAKLSADGAKTVASAIPCRIEDHVTRAVTRTTGGQEVFDYLKWLTDSAELDAELKWNAAGTEILLTPRA